jgi:hypothetical protein
MNTKSSTISPTILMHLMMAKYAEICAIYVLNKDIHLENMESFKIVVREMAMIT